MGTSDTSNKLKSAHSRARNPNRPKRDIASEVKQMEVMLSSVKMGRPTKLTEAIVQKLKQAFAIDATVEEACFYAGIKKQTYYNWRNAQPELFDDLEALRATPVLAARQTIAAASKNDVNTAKWLLERKRKTEYTARIEQTGANGAALPQPILALVNQAKANTDTKDDVIDGEIVDDSSQKDGLTLPTQSESSSRNIMEDIND
jgi:hypothetical protein